MYSYNNRFYNPNILGSVKIIKTKKEPIKYKCYLIFEVMKNEWHDVVFDRNIITQRASLNGCKKYIDSI